MKKLMLDAPGKRILTLGDEAIVRGGLEAGVNFVTTYPGAPASEVADAFMEVSKEIPEIYFEYSANEAVASACAWGGAWGGANSIVCFKMLGLNVAADIVQCSNYAGTKPGSLVIVHAGDPGLISSTNEADNRDIARHMGLPIFEPSGIQEAKDFMIHAVAMSKKWDLAVLFNFNTRLAHSMGDIELGSLEALSNVSPVGKFKSAKSRYIQAQAIGLENHRRLHKRLKKAKKWAEKNEAGLNKIVPGAESAKVGIITGGMSYGYVLEACNLLELDDIPILRLGIQFPIAEKTVVDFSSNLDKIIVVEEMDPFLEDSIKRVLFDAGIKLEIYGKDIYKRGVLPISGEFNHDIVTKAIMKVLPDAKPKIDISTITNKYSKVKGGLAQRMASFCAGCPHRATVYALKKTLNDAGISDKAVIGDDIGCYALAAAPPLSMGDYLICMSSGVGIGQGLAHRINTSDQPIFAFIGDSTFFHSGMPALLNAIYSNADITLIIMDNRWTALTGHQPLPHTGVNSLGEEMDPIKLYDICRSMGVKYIKVVDAYRIKTLQKVFLDCLNPKNKGPKVVISTRECNIQVDRRRRRAKLPEEIEFRYQIIPERCERCDECTKVFGCVAIRQDKDENGVEYYYIEEAKCTNCGVCKDVCPNGAIVETVLIRPQI
ncbi:MAG: thiamine pyrophosphate-dependent enzyme [Candidatus Helarchaeota archaeon]